MEKGKQTYKLPEGWIDVRLGDILVLEYGKSLPKRSRIESGKYKVYGSNGIIGSHNEALIEGPVIIVGRKGSVGKVQYEKDGCWPIDTTYYIKTSQSLFDRFIYFQLLSLNLGALDSSTAIPGINRNYVYDIKVNIPPFKEQQRIVSKIETLFSELNQAEIGLKKAKQQLVIYRHALLKSAFEGKLTKLWREENKLHSAEVLIMKIVSERNNLYKKEFAAWQDSHERWKKKKDEYKKPLKPKVLVFPAELKKIDIQALEKLPIGVIWTRVGFITTIEMGQSPSGDSYNNKGEGIQLINGPVEFGATPFSKTLAVKWTTEPTKLCEKDDLILCVRGSTTGKQNIANDIACIGRGVCSIKSEGVLQEYINHFFNYSNKKILEMGTGSTFPSVSKEQIQNLIIPLFSIQEQREIVTIIESRQTLIENLEKTIKSSLYNCEVFRYSILKEAFVGKLVNQDSSDESANKLLQKIKKEKEEYLKAQKELDKLKPKKKRQMDKKKTVLEILKEAKEPISTQELWTNSIHDGDIESFYSEIKKIYSKLEEVKEDTESLLSFKK